MVREFLRSRRARVTPEEGGLPLGLERAVGPAFGDEIARTSATQAPKCADEHQIAPDCVCCSRTLPTQRSFLDGYSTSSP